MTPRTNPVDPDATPRPNRIRPSRTRNAGMRYPRNASKTSPTREASVQPRVARSNSEDSVVFKALLLELPEVPETVSFAKDGFSSHSSHAPKVKELEVEHSKQLHKVVPCPGIMDNLISKLRESLKACRQPSENDPFMSRLSVESRCAHLPGNICSEHDTESWVHSAILRPAIAVAQYLIYDDTTTRDFPNTSSVGGPAPVPDSVVFKLYRDADNAVAAVEFKTHVVLGIDWFDAIHKLLACAQDSPALGSAAKFHWPDREDTEFDKATLVLLQVWGQMRNWNVQYGILSSYEHTYFLFKPQAVSDALYITNGFKPDNSDLLPATVSFLALALGHYSLSDLRLPEPSTEHWNHASMANFESTGLVPSTYPPRAGNVNRRR
ncbi:hypothetical protein CCMSSC00406_0009672 [Pleurotus cornucopiae]|uniref:Uncharacterized protein n=1 Tax=Pleurotus cornucopiae TaxID=5321 RepID=A0ACB7J9N6_PLECO|nr:hypothetical protein CCMSSC00406_0009672 [Pleurotus cornucopiae]